MIFFALLSGACVCRNGLVTDARWRQDPGAIQAAAKRQLRMLDRVASADRPLLLYTNHHVQSEYFPYGPADGMLSLGPWFDPELPLPRLGVDSLTMMPTRLHLRLR